MTADIDGGVGNDTLIGQRRQREPAAAGPTGSDVLRGGDGEDSLFAEGTGGDILDAGPGQRPARDRRPLPGPRLPGRPGFDIAGFGRYDLPLAGRRRASGRQLGGTADRPRPRRAAAAPRSAPTTRSSRAQPARTSSPGDNQQQPADPRPRGRRRDPRRRRRRQASRATRAATASTARPASTTSTPRTARATRSSTAARAAATALRDGSRPRRPRVRQGQGQEEEGQEEVARG